MSSLATSAVSNVVVPVAGLLGVPSGTTAVAFIVTGVSKPGSVAGFVTVFPAGAIQPPTSNLNVNGDGDVRPNLVIVPLGADGSIACDGHMGSIHKVGAALQDAPSCNGWTFWHVEVDGRAEPIDTLRQKHLAGL